MRVLLIGADGQLGRHLQPMLGAGHELSTSCWQGGDLPCDLGDAQALARMLDEARPEVVINAAAWTAVDAAEDQPEAAQRLNHAVPAALAGWCRQHQALLVHYSTDYVFDGQPGRPWQEDDAACPASVYGSSKLAGEQAIQASGARALILRTAWLYSALPGNFLSAILARAARGEALRVVADQIGSPTWAGSLARNTCELLRTPVDWQGTMILHAADRGRMSWHEFAVLAVELAARHGVIEHSVAVQAISSAEWPQRAQRPRWSVLDVNAIEGRLGRAVPSTAESLANCLREWETLKC